MKVRMKLRYASKARYLAGQYSVAAGNLRGVVQVFRVIEPDDAA
jgi:hypothetical protein